jgi:hypothetical protein
MGAQAASLTSPLSAAGGDSLVTLSVSSQSQNFYYILYYTHFSVICKEVRENLFLNFRFEDSLKCKLGFVEEDAREALSLFEKSSAKAFLKRGSILNQTFIENPYKS